MKIFILLCLLLSDAFSVAKCYNNTESVTTTLENETTTMLSQQENILVQVIDNYKEGLKKKREMMQALRKTVAEIEYLMKENQVLRKEMIQYWDDVIPLHSVMKSN